ncbi:MAG TPA: NTP transferase domain-containing protein [Lapillicoccus sp.]|nr:NTP transferase domain-containing protein [Lapillicoccus sp.]
MSDATALVLCGGDSTRLGTDKIAAALGGTTVLDHLLDALPPTWPVVAVGPERPTHRAVRWTRESPAGGGPTAGVAAGLALVETELVVVVAGDLPFAGPAAVGLVEALRRDPATDAVAAVDHSRPNPLLAAYRSARLRAVLPDPPGGRPARALLDLTHSLLAVPDETVLDVDTPEALAAARHRLAT